MNFSPFSEDWCTGSTILCDYIRDMNNTMSHSKLKEVLWPPYYFGEDMRGQSSYVKIAQNLMANIIIVKLQYISSEVEMDKLEVRTTITDKIANFGGTYGIWAELTGCSLLGMINLLFKLIFR